MGVQQGVIALICLLFVSWALNTILIWVELQCTQEGALIIFNRSSKGMGGRPLTFAWIVRRKPQELSHDSLPEHTWLENWLHHHSKILSGRKTRIITTQVKIAPLMRVRVWFLFSILEIDTNKLTKLYYWHHEWGCEWKKKTIKSHTSCWYKSLFTLKILQVNIRRFLVPLKKT